MRAQIIILTLFLGLISISGYAKTNDPQETQQKKIVKIKYDYNIFKLYFIDLKQTQIDSIALKDQLLERRRKTD